MQKIVPVLCTVWLLLSSVCFAAAADMRFVDAVDDTGYYVDVNSVNLISDDEAEAAVQIIIPIRNRLYIYKMHFNRAASTYQILTLAEFGTTQGKSCTDRISRLRLSRMGLFRQ